MPNDTQFMYELNDRLEALEHYERRRVRDMDYNRRMRILGISMTMLGAFPDTIEGNRNPWGNGNYYLVGGRVYTSVPNFSCPISVRTRIAGYDSTLLSGINHDSDTPRLGIVHPDLCSAWLMVQANSGWQNIAYSCMGCGIQHTITGVNNDNQT